jgi:protein-tyrosine-phosphatase
MRYGVAIFEQIGGDVTSPNVSLELGYMLAKDRPCLLLKDGRVSFLQADLAGHLCQTFDTSAIDQTVPPLVHEWLRDLGISKRAGEKLVVFVSTGGTCRDPMAKAITEALLTEAAPDLKVRVEAAAITWPKEDRVSLAARAAIQDMFGEDLLAKHQPQRLSPNLIADADIILVMTQSMLDSKIVPPNKTYLLSRFFGSAGDIKDPYPDGVDEETRARYAACAAELRTLIEPNLNRLINLLASPAT